MTKAKKVTSKKVTSKKATGKKATKKQTAKEILMQKFPHPKTTQWEAPDAKPGEYTAPPAFTYKQRDVVFGRNQPKTTPIVETPAETPEPDRVSLLKEFTRMFTEIPPVKLEQLNDALSQGYHEEHQLNEEAAVLGITLSPNVTLEKRRQILASVSKDREIKAKAAEEKKIIPLDKARANKFLEIVRGNGADAEKAMARKMLEKMGVDVKEELPAPKADETPTQEPPEGWATKAGIDPASIRDLGCVAENPKEVKDDEDLSQWMMRIGSTLTVEEQTATAMKIITRMQKKAAEVETLNTEENDLKEQLAEVRRRKVAAGLATPSTAKQTGVGSGFGARRADYSANTKGSRRGTIIAEIVNNQQHNWTRDALAQHLVDIGFGTVSQCKSAISGTINDLVKQGKVDRYGTEEGTGRIFAIPVAA